MKKAKAEKFYTPEADGFYGAYYPCGGPARGAFILMLGDSIDDYLVRTGAKWLNKRGFNCMAMSPAKGDYGHHNYPLERFGRAIAVLKSRGNEKIGIMGISTTGMLALTAASYYPDISMTVAMSPSDFIMEGFYQDGRDGAHERPGDGESTVSLGGKPLPYLPYAYRHPEYWQRIRQETKGSGSLICSAGMFEESERRHPVREEEKIKVENIRGRVLFIGARDDTLWDTCKYIERMAERLEQRPRACTYEVLTYDYGTHFVIPESLIKMLLPVGAGIVTGIVFRSARAHPKECRRTRRDIDIKLSHALNEW